MTDLDLGFERPRGKTRVVAAMSGGVDSAVTAALLKQAGYDVVGVTLQLYDHGAAVNKPGACCAGQDIHDARRAAELLGIPHYVLDYESRFRESVIDEFADSYLAGETPIPCVKCNQTVKFKDLRALAQDLGADALATGHYVRRELGAHGPELHRGADPSRDQSYFLFATTRDQLNYLRFPIGHLPKDRVRALAAEFGLKIAAKPDSQDICFVPNGNYASVIEKLRPGAAEPGEIVHVDGRVMGEHKGVIRYTVGQRRGLGVATGEPLFVVKLDADRKRVIVGPREALAVKRAHLKDVNWIGDPVDDVASLDGRDVLVRVRSTRAPVPAKLRIAPPPLAGEVAAKPSEGAASRRAPLSLAALDSSPVNGRAWSVELTEAEEGVAPGQAAVFYDPQGDGARVLGGGWIKGTENDGW